MIFEERLLKVLHTPRVSEKSSAMIKKNNVFVLKVAKCSTKMEIKAAVQKLFKAEARNINTLIVKGKFKRHGQRIGHCNNWKKAYVSLREGQNLDFLNNTVK